MSSVSSDSGWIAGVGAAADFIVPSPPNADSSLGVDDRQLRCSEPGCQRTFLTTGSLNKHVSAHAKDKPFACATCPATFAQSSSLKVHQRRHTGDKPFACPNAHCESAFTTSGVLKTHLRTHTGERPFACPFEGCQSSFSQSSHLKVHERIHSGERPYRCDFEGCTRACRTSGDVKKHRRTHAGARPSKPSSVGNDPKSAQAAQPFPPSHLMQAMPWPYLQPRMMFPVPQGTPGSSAAGGPSSATPAWPMSGPDGVPFAMIASPFFQQAVGASMFGPMKNPMMGLLAGQQPFFNMLSQNGQFGGFGFFPPPPGDEKEKKDKSDGKDGKGDGKDSSDGPEDGKETTTELKPDELPSSRSPELPSLPATGALPSVSEELSKVVSSRHEDALTLLPLSRAPGPVEVVVLSSRMDLKRSIDELDNDEASCLSKMAKLQ